MLGSGGRRIAQISGTIITLALAIAGCQAPSPTAGGVSLTPVTAVSTDPQGHAQMRLRVSARAAAHARRVMALPASWTEAVVTFDSATVRTQPIVLTVPFSAFTPIAGGEYEFVADGSSAPSMPVLRPSTDYVVNVDLRTAGGPADLEGLGWLVGQAIASGANTLSLTVLNTLDVALYAGEPSLRNSPGSLAFFERPSGVAVDAAGAYAYVADTDNHAIRRVDIGAQTVTTIAGSGQPAKADGTGTAARFNAPEGLAIDGDTLYVADRANHAIRVVDLTPLITAGPVVTTTLAGGNGIGYVDGAAGSSQFSGPRGLAVDPGVALYVADTDNHMIRRIDLATSTVTTVAGTGAAGLVDGDGTSAEFKRPIGLALADPTTLYVADSGNGAVRKIDMSTSPATVSTVSAGIGGVPDGLVFDGTDLWVSVASGADTVYRLALDGTLTLVAGGSSNGFGTGTGSGGSASFSGVAGMAMKAGGGDLYIADRDNHALRRLLTGSGVVDTLVGSPAAGWVDDVPAGSRFRTVGGVCLDPTGRYLYVADTGNHRVRMLDRQSATVTTVAGDGIDGYVDATGAAARFSSPMDVALDPTGATLYVADTGNRRLRAIDVATGAVTTLAGSGTDGALDGNGLAAEFSAPRGLTVDAAGDLYVADETNHAIRRVTATGDVTTFAGGNGSGLLDGPRAAARFSSPSDVVLDGFGALWVADARNHALRRIRLSDGVVSTPAGSASTPGSDDGPGTSATFREPRGLAADPGGNVYVADYQGDAIRKIARDGYVTTVAGGTNGAADGHRTSAYFNGPLGLAVGTAAGDEGALYVADANNHVVRHIQ